MRIGKNKNIGKFRVRRWFASRMRRGHGIHSPFAYSLIRYVFGEIGNYELRITNYEFAAEALSGLDVSRKTVGRIERLCRMCGCENVVISNYMAGMDNIEATPPSGSVLCVIKPLKSHAKRELRRHVAQNHDGMSIESRDMMIIFTDKGLNKQHIRV